MLHQFENIDDGATPGYGDLIFDQAGNIYGTTMQGGYECVDAGYCGTVFGLTTPSLFIEGHRLRSRLSQNLGLQVWDYKWLAAENNGVYLSRVAYVFKRISV